MTFYEFIDSFFDKNLKKNEKIVTEFVSSM